MPLLEHLSFAGLIRNRDLRELTHSELINAFKKNGWTEASHTGRPHFLQRLADRGPRIGLHTLGHLERAVRNGTTADGKHGRKNRLLPCNAFISYDPRAGQLFTFCPGDPSTSRES